MRVRAGCLARLQLLSRAVAFSTMLVSFIAQADQSPFMGSPLDVPRLIEAEWFDNGGEGIAYHDSSPTNEPAGGRNDEAVDVERSDVASNGADVGWVTPGEWLEYSLGVRYTGDFKINVRYAALGFGGVMHVEIGGVDVTGPITLADTGGWQTWQTVGVPWVRLSQTDNTVMRLVFDQGNNDGWLANIDYVSIEDMQSSQMPYNGQIQVGRIEAEHYDEGGEGVAYHDVTPENEPNAFRPNDGVDVEVTSDEGGGYNVGWIQAGEWLEYITYFGGLWYTLDIRYAADGYGGSMHVEFDGYDVTGPIELVDTGGWQNWETISIPRVLGRNGGVQVRLVFDTAGPDGWLANINYIQFKTGPYKGGGPTPTIPGMIGAANFDIGGEGVAYHDSTPQNEGGHTTFYYQNTGHGVDVEPTQDEGGGYDVGWITPGEWLYYTVNVQQAGNYDVHLRYAADGFGGVMHVEFNEEDKTGPISLPDTGGWQTWRTVTIPNVPLEAGMQHLILVFDEGNADGWLANIRYVQFDKSQ